MNVTELYCKKEKHTHAKLGKDGCYICTFCNGQIVANNKGFWICSKCNRFVVYV